MVSLRISHGVLLSVQKWISTIAVSDHYWISNIEVSDHYWISNIEVSDHYWVSNIEVGDNIFMSSGYYQIKGVAISMGCNVNVFVEDQKSLVNSRIVTQLNH